VFRQWSCDHEDADEADDDRSPTLCIDVFLEHHRRERNDEMMGTVSMTTVLWPIVT